ncbi:hypothetical protein HY988_03225 [Candidatus Micrarchaeota archaeon]|nr:hypothetical protein [Candidatus Micrarchaeota archaeon]
MAHKSKKSPFIDERWGIITGPKYAGQEPGTMKVTLSNSRVIEARLRFKHFKPLRADGVVSEAEVDADRFAIKNNVFAYKGPVNRDGQLDLSGAEVHIPFVVDTKEKRFSVTTRGFAFDPNTLELESGTELPSGLASKLMSNLDVGLDDSTAAMNGAELLCSQSFLTLAIISPGFPAVYAAEAYHGTPTIGRWIRDAVDNLAKQSKELSVIIEQGRKKTMGLLPHILGKVYEKK